MVARTAFETVRACSAGNGHIYKPTYCALSNRLHTQDISRKTIGEEGFT